MIRAKSNEVARGVARLFDSLGFVYAPNRMYSSPGTSSRLATLVDTLYEVLT